MWVSGRLTGRVLWLVMLVMHAPPLFASWKALLSTEFHANRLAGCLLLTASMVFFALKLRGVSYLRFRQDYRSSVAIGVAIVLLHASCIGTRIECVEVPQSIPLAASTLLAAGLTRVQETLSGFSLRLSISYNPLLNISDSPQFVAFSPHHWNLAAQICTPRPPPAFASIS